MALCSSSTFTKALAQSSRSKRLGLELGLGLALEAAGGAEEAMAGSGDPPIIR
jgi:hypothetical protein